MNDLYTHARNILIVSWIGIFAYELFVAYGAGSDMVRAHPTLMDLSAIFLNPVPYLVLIVLYWICLALLCYCVFGKKTFSTRKVALLDWIAGGVAVWGVITIIGKTIN